MTNYPCVSKEAGSSVYKASCWVISWITETQWKKLLRRLVLSPLLLPLYGANTNSSLLCNFFYDQYFCFTTLHLSDSFPALWETLGVMPLPDPAFLEIIRSSISGSSVPLARSTNRTALCRALRVLFSSWHPLGVTQTYLLVFCC